MLTGVLRVSLPLLLFCAIGVARTESAELVDRIVAIVNDEIISLYELNQVVEPYEEKIKRSGYPPEKEREMLYRIRDDLLANLIDKKLTVQETKRINISVAEKEVDTTIERIKESKLLTDEELRAELAGQGLTFEQFRNQLKEELLRSKLVNREVKSKIVITKEDIASYYQNNLDKYKGEKKYQLANIFIRVSPYADQAEKEKIYNKMNEIREKIAQGQNVKTLLDEYAEGSFELKGGNLGRFKLDELSPEINQEVSGLGVGGCSDVLETDFGYQFVIVSDIIENPGKSLEEASPEIEQTLYREIVNKRFASWLENLRKKSHIKVIK